MEILLLAIAALAAFGGCLFAPFQFDDFALFSDPVIASPSGWWQCWRIAQTRPLTWFSFWANFQLGGRTPWGYHAVNLTLHLAVVVLVWDVLRRLISPRIALVAAAIFAVHPILTEPVAYVFARGTLIAALFSLLAIRSWLDGRPWLAVAWFAVAMTGKEECAALPVVLLLLGKPKNARSLAAMFGVALAFGLRAIWATSVTAGSGAGTQSGISPLSYLATQGVVILRYLRLLVIPWGFTVDADIPRPSAWLAILAWAAIAALAAALLKSPIGKNTRAGLWFVAGLVLLLPSSSIFPAADLAVDRRMYLPMVAFCACATLLCEWILSSFDRRVAIGAAVAVIITLCGISIRYTNLWRSPEALWTEAILRAPRKARPRVQLARALPPARALEVLARAAEVAPDDPAVASEQGRDLLALGRPGDALAAFGRALALDPENPAALSNRGAALLALGQTDAARADFERSLKRDGCFFDARLNLLRMGIRAVASEECRYTPEQRMLLNLDPVK